MAGQSSTPLPVIQKLRAKTPAPRARKRRSLEDGVDPVRAGSMEFLSGVTELNHVGYPLNCTATDPSIRHSLLHLTVASDVTDRT